MTSGIYIIRNTESGKVYIGSAVNVRVRLRGHRSGLVSGIHPNKPPDP